MIINIGCARNSKRDGVINSKINKSIITSYITLYCIIHSITDYSISWEVLLGIWLLGTTCRRGLSKRPAATAQVGT